MERNLSGRMPMEVVYKSGRKFQMDIRSEVGKTFLEGTKLSGEFTMGILDEEQKLVQRKRNSGFLGHDGIKPFSTMHFAVSQRLVGRPVPQKQNCFLQATIATINIFMSKKEFGEGETGSPSQPG
ncbi:hypothetical protein HPP92_014916 [Vanilla planifolia]|uniref:Uncharacterized protein n=1 Tax=Vanilla planifolia TaxID=51239 RepID=A0A835QI80_VANPL|nr:hypothetical protein HPP92_014916 [Vanilla planifolia]